MRYSPVLFGRDELLALGRRRLDSARAGNGQLLFLAGEAGIGKTRLLAALAREAHSDDMTVHAGAVFPGEMELSGGLLLDLAHALARSPVPASKMIGASVTRALTGRSPDVGDAHRRRRLVVLEVVDRIAELAVAGPTMLALEDLHWSDDLTLDVLAQLTRRLPELPMLVVGTYRSDELYPRVPMREWRARLLGQRMAEEVRLRRLTLDEVHSMTTLLVGGGTEASRLLVETLHDRSNGIPLHVEELVSATTDGSATADRLAVPDTLRDAILQRRSALSGVAKAVAGAAAVIGRTFDLDLLAAVADRSLEDVAGGVEELLERGFVTPAAPGWFDFRHALIRDVLEGAVPLARRRGLHSRVAMLARDRPAVGAAAYRSAHHESAGETDAAHREALVAARQATAVSNHREALDLYRRAVRCAPPDLADQRLADLLIARATEAEATDDNATAADDYARAYEILIGAQQAVAAARVLPRLAAVRHLLGDGLEVRVGLLEQGAAALTATALPEEATAHVRGQLAAGLSAAYMLDRRLEESIAHGEQALSLSTAAGDEATELNTLATLGAVLVFAGQLDAGWGRLEDAIRRGRAQRWEAEAARAYRMLATSASVLVEYERAEQWLREGIEYAERTEQWNHRHYMAAHLGHVLWATGRWAEGREVAEHAIADGRGGITTWITALHVRGFLALGRGDRKRAVDGLTEAREIATGMGELQRLSPALWGLAEQAVLDHRWADAAALCAQGYQASAAVRDAAYLFPFLVTGTRALIEAGDPVEATGWVDTVSAALLDRSIPGTLPAVAHARGLIQMAAGSTGLARTALMAARAGWLERHRIWESQWATIDLAHCAYRANRPAEAAALLADARRVAEALGAAPLITAIDAGDAQLHGHRTTESAWAPLTTREFEVAQLVATGRTNRELATALHITVRTAGTHVEHILAKLGAGRRAEIAAWVMRVKAE